MELMMSDLLEAAIDGFVETMADALGHVIHRTESLPYNAIDDAAIEAFDLLCSVADAVGSSSSFEVPAILPAVSPRFVALELYARVHNPGHAPKGADWIQSPSALFDLLVRFDRRMGTSYGWWYLHSAIELAGSLVGLETEPSEADLRLLDAFRTTLVSHLEGVGGPRPGVPARYAEVRTTSGADVVAAGRPTMTSYPMGSPLGKIDELLSELDAFVGLEGVKAEIRLVTALLQVRKLRRQHGLPVVEGSRHLVFAGNPGTGKTTVARLLARIYQTLGVVAHGHLVETDRSGLVAGYVGQTALKVTEVFDAAQGGVLLIDEAYALARGGDGDFGREAIDTFVKLMEDRRSELVVIVAGYPDEMSEFIGANPGLHSRFPKTIAFPDYTDDELIEIFLGLCSEKQYEPTPGALDRLRSFFAVQPRTKGFGNGRLARNAFEEAVANQAVRIMGRSRTEVGPTAADLTAIELVDIPTPTR